MNIPDPLMWDPPTPKQGNITKSANKTDVSTSNISLTFSNRFFIVTVFLFFLLVPEPSNLPCACGGSSLCPSLRHLPNGVLQVRSGDCVRKMIFLMIPSHIKNNSTYCNYKVYVNFVENLIHTVLFNRMLLFIVWQGTFCRYVLICAWQVFSNFKVSKALCT